MGAHPPGQRTVFLTQTRAISDSRQDPWHDGCDGHDDMYTAIACMETTRAAIDGKIKSPTGQRFHHFVAMQLTAYGPGARMELRIVKRTTTITDEVVDGVGAEAAEAKDAG